MIDADTETGATVSGDLFKKYSTPIIKTMFDT